jgi:hypothetical protein
VVEFAVAGAAETVAVEFEPLRGTVVDVTVEAGERNAAEFEGATPGWIDVSAFTLASWAVGATADLSFESLGCADALPAFVGALVDGAKASAPVTGLGAAAGDGKPTFATIFGLAFESIFESSFALGFSGGDPEAGDLTARSSCVDMEFSSLLSRTPGVDTKDLVAADVLASCALAAPGVAILRVETD